MKNNKWLWIIIALLFLIGGGLIGYYFISAEKTEEVELPKEEVPVFAEHLASYTEKGVVTLYNVDEAKKVDEVDLKTLTSKTEKIIEIDTPPQEEQPKENYDGLHKVEITIKEGEHVWGIQSNLTPEINTVKLLPILKEINKGKSLHPVYPNEKRIFLTGTIEQTPQKVTTETTITQTVADSTFIYYTDLKNETMYAYSEFANEVYKMTVEKDKWKVETIASVTTNQVSDWLYVDKERVWLANKEHNHIQVFEIENTSNLIEWDAKGVMSQWYIDGEFVTYTYDDRMRIEQIGYGEKKDILLGDRTSDFVFVQNKFYVLNNFGKGLQNSILLKVDPQELYIDDLIELKSDETAILSHGLEGNLYIGKIEKTKDLEGNVKEEPKVLSLDLTSKNLKQEEMNYELIFSPNMKGWNNHLYAVEDGNIKIYPTGTKNSVKEFSINQETFSLLP